jgi:hypothetical protein
MFPPAAIVCPDTAVFVEVDSERRSPKSKMLYQELEDYFGIECESSPRDKWNSEFGEHRLSLR